jgi:dTDP-4-amino-4,6-dideoxygalactose transaminase
MKEYKRIPLSKPGLTESDIESAVTVLKSGRLECGPMVEAFERRLSEYLNVRYAVCVSSGTAALHLGLLALGIRPGDDVIVPAFGCPAGANVVERLGARQVFVDSEPGGFNMDVNKIENNITARTRAIMIIHNFGFAVEMDNVRALSAKYDIPIIEDAAGALGSSYKDVKCGNMGRLAAFSFHPRKILTTGEGGALVTDDLDLAEKVKLLRNHGRDLTDGADFVLPGFNSRMTEFQAALGVSQMSRLEETLKSRIAAAAYYNVKLADVGLLRLPVMDDNRKSNFQSYAAFVSSGRRDEVIGHLKHNNIESGTGVYSIPHTGYYSEKYKFDGSQYPEALKARDKLICLPLYDGISRDEQDYVIETLKKLNTSKASYILQSA